jgi:hypothetical protein
MGVEEVRQVRLTWLERSGCHIRGASKRDTFLSFFTRWRSRSLLTIKRIYGLARRDRAGTTSRDL